MSIEKLQPNKTIGLVIRGALFAGMIYFGFIFPDSLSDHTKILHFSAHVGMSFLVATSIYVLCNLMLRMSRTRSLVILSVVTLVIGAIYKYLEIAGEGILHSYSPGVLLKITGVYTSMSQNTAGLLAAILLIEYSVQYVRTVGYRKLKEWVAGALPPERKMDSRMGQGGQVQGPVNQTDGPGTLVAS